MYKTISKHIQTDLAKAIGPYLPLQYYTMLHKHNSELYCLGQQKNWVLVVQFAENWMIQGKNVLAKIHNIP